MSKAEREAFVAGAEFAPQVFWAFEKHIPAMEAEAGRRFPNKPCKNVREIVVEWLKENGYDGLYEPGCECGCFIDDLAPCDGLCENCIPGYRVKCVDEYTGKEVDGVGPGVLREGKIVEKEGE